MKSNRKQKQVTDKGYATYVKEFTKKVKSLAKRDAFPLERKLLSRVAWEQTYKATRNTLVKDVAEGKRKAIGNVNQYIISKQVYKVSSAKAKTLQEAWKSAFGTKLSLTHIRTGELDEAKLYNQIEEEYAKGRASGHSAKQLQILIGQFYFGSE